MNSAQIIFEDEFIIAVSKPAGMIVNKADTSRGADTLQDFSEKKINLLHKKGQETDKNTYVINGYNKYDEFISRGGIVHRLDKETSGIILIAKTPEAFIELQNQFKNKTIQKKYVTLVHGTIEIDSGVIDAPIGRLPWNRMRFGVIDGGRTAITRYKVLKRYKDFTLLEIYPETGRTHQIRVHMQYIKHPVFADELYAGRKTGRDDRKLLPRHFLHAKELSFTHPMTKKHMTLTSLLPAEVQSFLESLEYTKK